MKALVLTTDAFGGFGGIAQYNRHLLTALAAFSRSSEVTCVPRLVPGPVGRIPNDVSYVTEGVGSKRAYVLTAVRVALKQRFDVIICGHIHLLPIATLIGAIRRAPVVLVIYGIEAWTPRRSLVRPFLKRNSAVISISRITQERFLSWAHSPAPQFILPNAVDLSQFGPEKKSAELVARYGLEGKVTLMTLARLVSTKGIDKVLGVLPELRASIPNLHYVIAGDGPERERLRRLASALGVTESVTFTGRVTEKEKADHYRLADAFVMPSHGDGFGFVFLEAMACGVPVVASSVDGGREAVRDGELGGVANPDDPEELSTAILSALNEPRATVLDGLSFFFYDKFESRCRNIMKQVLREEAT